METLLYLTRHEMLKCFVLLFRTRLIMEVLNVGSMDGLYYKQSLSVCSLLAQEGVCLH